MPAWSNADTRSRKTGAELIVPRRGVVQAEKLNHDLALSPVRMLLPDPCFPELPIQITDFHSNHEALCWGHPPVYFKPHGFDFRRCIAYCHKQMLPPHIL